MTLLSGLPEVIDDSEPVARFLTQRSHIANGIVTAAAFLPNPKDRETSVFRAVNLPRTEMWPHGVLAAGQRTLYGAVFLKAHAAQAANLRVVSLRAATATCRDCRVVLERRRQTVAESEAKGGRTSARAGGRTAGDCANALTECRRSTEAVSGTSASQVATVRIDVISWLSPPPAYAAAD